MRDLETIREYKKELLEVNRLLTILPKIKRGIEQAIEILDEWEKENGTESRTDRQ